MSWDMYDTTQKMQVIMVTIGLPLVLLAASLWHDWVEEGKSPRARKIMKDWNWNIDEMAHAINMKGHMIGYRLLQVGVMIYLMANRLMRDYFAKELAVILIVSLVAEMVFVTFKTLRNAAGDEDPAQMKKQLRSMMLSNILELIVVLQMFYFDLR